MEEEPKAPKGDFSELAKADRPEEANAEDEVVLASEDPAGAGASGAAAVAGGCFGEVRAPKGEIVAVFANPDVRFI